MFAIQLTHLERALAERNITLHLSEAACDYLIGKGYNPAYGARPIKRVIQRQLQNQLALRLLEGQLNNGDAMLVDLDAEGQLIFM